LEEFMSKFHSMVSRRDFMKGLGLAGAGIGAVAASAPVFHDIDELIASDTAVQPRPWWVKERPIDDPTIEVDFSMMERHDGRNQGQSARVRAIYYGADRVLGAAALSAAELAERTASNYPGYTYRSRALAGSFKRVSQGTSPGWAETKDPAPVKTPEERGEPKWTGSPEEASRMLRAAMRAYGASLVGYTELTQEHRDHVIFSYEKGDSNNEKYIGTTVPVTAARPIVFESVPKAYETTEKLVIPNVPLWEIALSTQGSNELWRSAGTLLGGMANANTFYNCANLHASTYNFLRYLGYQLIGTIGNDSRYVGSEGGAAIMAGLGEASRQKLYTLTPEYGAPGRLYGVLTDLPLEPTHPIDAGIYRFCHSCQKCADSCPPQCISKEKEPSWDLPLTEGKETIYSVKGTKAFYNNLPLCRQYSNETSHGCRICWGECTFTVNRGALVHQIIKGTIANVPLFNTYFYKLGAAFGYGTDPEKAETWWDLSLPTLGQDSTIVAADAGYGK
jgi:reductive dehalogenase